MRCLQDEFVSSEVLKHVYGLTMISLVDTHDGIRRSLSDAVIGRVYYFLSTNCTEERKTFTRSYWDLRATSAYPIFFFSRTDLKKLIDLEAIRKTHYEKKVAVSTLWKYMVPVRQQLMKIYKSRFPLIEKLKENVLDNIPSWKINMNMRDIADAETRHNKHLVASEKRKMQFTRSWNDNLFTKLSRFARFKST